MRAHRLVSYRRYLLIGDDLSSSRFQMFFFILTLPPPLLITKTQKIVRNDNKDQNWVIFSRGGDIHATGRGLDHASGSSQWSGMGALFLPLSAVKEETYCLKATGQERLMLEFRRGSGGTDPSLRPGRKPSVGVVRVLWR